jgi:hypothetical protein
MQRLRVRRLAFHVLVAWLFAIATGFVNACVVQLEMHGAPQAVSHAAHAVMMHVDEAAAHAAMGHEAAGAHEHEPDSANIPCERFCDEPVAQPAKPFSDPFNGFWLASAPAPAFYYFLSANAHANFEPGRIRGGESIPIAIAFLRLTL